MNVEIGAEAPLFPEKEYISRIFIGACDKASSQHKDCVCWFDGQ